MAMLEAFVHDPLLNWRLMDNTQPKGKRSVVAEGETGPSAPASTSAIAPDPSLDPAPAHALSPTSMGPHSQAREDGGVSEALNKKAVAIVHRVRDKLTGRDFCTEDSLDVHRQVELLIAQATSHENLCQCYIGWCPFW